MTRNQLTREQRRQRRRVLWYRVFLAVLTAAVALLLIATVRYCMYVQDLVRNSTPYWEDARPVGSTDDLDADALAAASARYDCEQDPALYAQLLEAVAKNGQKKPPQGGNLETAGSQSQN